VSKTAFDPEAQKKFKQAINVTWSSFISSSVKIVIEKIVEVASNNNRRRLLRAGVDLQVTTAFTGLTLSASRDVKSELDKEKVAESSNKTTEFVRQLKQLLPNATAKMEAVNAAVPDALPSAPTPAGAADHTHIIIWASCGGGALFLIMLVCIWRRRKANLAGHQRWVRTLRNDQVDMLARNSTVEMDTKAASKPLDTYSIEIDEIEVEEY